RATDLKALLQNFGRATQTKDPFIHFYETFLAEYDPKLRKSRGVWYTPEPVVNFIVRAVDDVLKNEFNLPKGLADNSKTKITRKAQGTARTKGKKKGEDVYEEVEVHKVQILDPATGTGTFLAEVIKQVHEKFKGQEGLWSNYVEEHLIPRLNGFEILMASYSMAHLKLEMLLEETGYKAQKEQRFNVYLTNSLEEHHPDTGTLFASWLSREANEANRIKRDNPVMVVLGNPPYSGESTNKGEWINGLIDIYKKDHNSQKIPDTKWLNNDYVKFLRYGQHFIEKNGSGILAFITDNSYLDSISFRGMRWHLLKTYDTIHVLNLHGNSLKKETCPDGSKDKNVFDIKQGVSINIFVKTGKKKTNELSKIYYYDLFGKRNDKYNFLWQNSLKTIDYKELPNVEPHYFFVPKDFSSQKDYDTFFKIDELLKLNGVGVCSKRDNTAIQFTKNELVKVLGDFKSLPEKDLKQSYKTEGSESRDKKTIYAKENIIKFGVEDKYLQKINYRPFDIRNTYFTNKSRGFLAYPVYAIMQHFTKTNYGLIVSKKSRQLSLGYMFITSSIVDLHILDSAADSTYVFPLYLYPDSDDILSASNRKPNLDMKIVDEIASDLEMTFTDEKEITENTFAPIDILDYIYAVLHSPAYREKYKEFLKIDFPRVPYPEDKETFWKLVKLGGEIRQLHLLESPTLEDYITQYPKSGDNVITRKINKNDWEIIDPEQQLGRIWINDEQYFANIPLIAWEFYIGGYQPAQKWLKDRRNRELSYDDILHYQKIIIALSETNRLMKEIDTVMPE
ncbi:MAG: N-6 DNA methylase, partial [Victivallaceae bacterium]|nr:N-6 DNA methylase [Victivallaceae bacterium]